MKILTVWLGACVAALAVPALAAPLAEPPVFASEKGVLDLLMVARAAAVEGFGRPGFAPKGWVYEVCKRPAAGNACPAGAAAPYGGVRLALQPGDSLKIRLVNQLPPVDPASLDHDPDDALLALNPTNLHTHGLLVDAAANTAIPPATPTYGDFIFTSVFNPANGDPAAVNLGAYTQLHAHGDVVKDGVVDYVIPIPLNHPSGLFYFHPHMHGIALPQISAGLAGAITIGDPQSYICLDAACDSRFPASRVRHMLLKEMQVLPGPGGGMAHLETDAAFCQPDPAPGEPPRNGFCPSDPAAYPAGGFWFYTINGARFPTIAQASADGEIWRLVNAAGSVTYDLKLTDDATQRALPMQIIALDGVSLAVPSGTAAGAVVAMAGAKIRYAPCPTGAAAPARASQPVCATEIFMMPSSRVEVWVSYSDAQNRFGSAPAGASATLHTLHYNTGPEGDDWPAVDLAKVRFAAGPRQGGGPLYVNGDVWGQTGTVGPSDIKGHTPTPPACAPLAPGHRRRLFFANLGVETDGVAAFGVGYEEIDAKGEPVPGTFHAVEPFNPAHEICLPLGPDNSVRYETWEIVNLAGELHNFHIHQTKFRVLTAAAPGGSELSGASPQAAPILADNVPLPFARPVSGYGFPPSGSCTIADYRGGRCKVSPVVVQIPFTRIGRFVFHCHILEHEDGGMMHAIRVLRAP